jgi:hypothetical protein
MVLRGSPILRPTKKQTNEKEMKALSLNTEINNKRSNTPRNVINKGILFFGLVVSPPEDLKTVSGSVLKYSEKVF